MIRPSQNFYVHNTDDTPRWIRTHDPSVQVSTLDCNVTVIDCNNLALNTGTDTSVYPKVSGLAALSENYKRYSSLQLDAVVSLFCESV